MPNTLNKSTHLLLRQLLRSVSFKLYYMTSNLFSKLGRWFPSQIILTQGRTLVALSHNSNFAKHTGKVTSAHAWQRFHSDASRYHTPIRRNLEFKSGPFPSREKRSRHGPPFWHHTGQRYAQTWLVNTTFIVIPHPMRAIASLLVTSSTFLGLEKGRLGTSAACAITWIFRVFLQWFLLANIQTNVAAERDIWPDFTIPWKCFITILNTAKASKTLHYAS